MPESSIKNCLDLCALALAQNDEERSQTLVALKNSLHALDDEKNQCKAEPIFSESGPEWLHEPVITMDMAGYITDWSRGAQILFGYTVEEAVGQHVLFLYADESVDNDSDIHELFLDHGSPVMEVRRCKKSGDIFRANLLLNHILDENNEPIGMVARLSEIADHLSISEKQRLHARIIENSEEGILITDINNKIVSVNNAFTRITGYSASEAIGKTPDILRSGVHSTDFRSEVLAAMHGAGAWHGEIIGKRKNGELFPQSVSIGVVRNANNEITHSFSVFSDISVLRATEERMQRLVNYDSLTGLPNRTLFQQLAEQALISAHRKHEHGALLVIDLNRFASVNDTLGHEVGDELLR